MARRGYVPGSLYFLSVTILPVYANTLDRVFVVIEMGWMGN